MDQRICLSLLLALLFQAPALSAGESSHVDAVRHHDRLIVAGYPEQGNPFMSIDLGKIGLAVHDPERYVGIDAELVSRIAERLGVEVYYKIPRRIEISALIQMVARGEADMAASALSITDERRRTVDFSRPYYSFHLVVVTRDGTKISRFEDLSGMRAAIGRGSSQEEHLRRTGFRPDQLVATSFSIESVEALLDQRADFILEDPDIARAMVTTYPSIGIRFEAPILDGYGIAVPKGSDLASEINAVLEELEESGGLKSLVEKHLAVTETLDRAASLQ